MAQVCVTCTRCRRVSVALTRAQAEQEVEEFNAYYASLDREGKARFSGPLTLSSFSCACGGTEFVEGGSERVPDGSTMSGVFWEAAPTA